MRPLVTAAVVAASWFLLLLALGAPIAVDAVVAVLALCAAAVAMGLAGARRPRGDG